MAAGGCSLVAASGGGQGFWHTGVRLWFSAAPLHAGPSPTWDQVPWPTVIRCCPQGSPGRTNLKGKIRKYHTVSRGNRKWGLAAHRSKADEEPRLMGRSLLYFGCQRWGGGKAVRGVCVCES